MATQNLFRKLRPVAGFEKLDQYWALYLISGGRQKKSIENVMQLKAMQNLGMSFETEDLLLPPDKNAIFSGKYTIGQVVYGNRVIAPFGINDIELTRHVQILGMTGFGKTTMCCWLLLQLHRHKVPFMVLDWKSTYRDLLQLPGTDDVQVYTVGQNTTPFCFNPFMAPDGLSREKQEAYQREIVALVCEKYIGNPSLLSFQGVEYLLQRGLSVLESSGVPVTPQNMYRWAIAFKGQQRERDWKYSLINTLYRLSTGSCGRVYNVSQNMSPEQLLGQPLILELEALGSERDKAFFVEAMLLWLYHYRKIEHRRETLKHLLVLEEAQHVVQKRSYDHFQPITDTMFREVREYGQGIVMLVQNPSQISVSSMGNTYTTICLCLKHQEDIQAVSKAIQLHNSDLLGKLKIGQAVVRLQGRTPNPFMVMIPKLPMHKGLITDLFLSKRHSKTGLTGQTAPDEACLVQNSTESHDNAQQTPEQHSDHQGTLRCRSAKTLLLSNIAEEPLLNIRQHYTAVSVSAYLGTKLQKELLCNKLISAHRISTFHGTTKLLSITEAGVRYLAENGIEAQTTNHIEHKFWVQKVKQKLVSKSNGQLTLKDLHEEVAVENGFVDIVADMAGSRIAIEVETGKSDAVKNIRKCLEQSSMFDGVVCMATNNKCFEKIQLQLSRAGLFPHRNVRLRLIR